MRKPVPVTQLSIVLARGIQTRWSSEPNIDRARIVIAMTLKHRLNDQATKFRVYHSKSWKFDFRDVTGVWKCEKGCEASCTKFSIYFPSPTSFSIAQSIFLDFPRPNCSINIHERSRIMRRKRLRWMIRDGNACYLAVSIGRDRVKNQ